MDKISRRKATARGTGLSPAAGKMAIGIAHALVPGGNLPCHSGIDSAAAGPGARAGTATAGPGVGQESGLFITCDAAAELARSLKTWRALRRVKQMQAADLLGVSQATISRWENGLLAPTAAEQAAIRALLAARLDSAADHQLAGLVSQSSRPMHLICDLTHRLLAWSALRAAEARRQDNLIGSSLWRFASDELREAEQQLPALGWYQPAPPAVTGRTGANRSRDFRIRPGRFRFTRFQLSDGSYARLVETLAA